MTSDPASRPDPTKEAETTEYAVKCADGQVRHSQYYDADEAKRKARQVNDLAAHGVSGLGFTRIACSGEHVVVHRTITYSPWMEGTADA